LDTKELLRYRIRQLIVRVSDDGPNYFKRDIPKLTSNFLAYYDKADSTGKDFAINTLTEW